MKKNDISRRKFIKNLSGSVVGAGIALGHSPIKANAQDQDGSSSAGKYEVSLKVNGEKVSLYISPETTLVELLRDRIGLTGTKVSCNHGECGACTVLLNGKPVYSCHILALDARDAEVVTIEGLSQGEQLHPIQQAFVDHDGLQCGFCTPGQIMAAQGLLLKHPAPTRQQVLEGMSGNLCRCAAYPNILESAMAAAEKKK